MRSVLYSPLRAACCALVAVSVLAPHLLSCAPGMPAYHSEFNTLGVQEVCGCALLPIKTRARGPAPSIDPSGKREGVRAAADAAAVDARVSSLRHARRRHRRGHPNLPGERPVQKLRGPRRSRPRLDLPQPLHPPSAQEGGEDPDQGGGAEADHAARVGLARDARRAIVASRHAAPFGQVGL